MRKDERGYIIVETVGAFTMFVFLIVSILSLVNVVTVQARMHYAMTQTAETVSMYAYVLDLMGVSEKFQGIAEKASKVEKSADELKTDINLVISSIEKINLSGLQTGAQGVINKAQSAAEDPKAVLQSLMSWAVNEAGGEAFEHAVVRPLMKRYLANGTMSGEEFLEKYHVIGGLKGLNFHNVDLPLSWDAGSNRLVSGDGQASAVIDKNGDVRIVVKYKIDYTFGALPLPFDGGLTIVQEVTTKAWGSGVGEGYSRSEE